MAEPALSRARIEELIKAYYPAPTEQLLEALAKYLELLLKWNERTNLTAIRDPAEIVSRHFGESLFVARHLPPCRTLLDLGSGAGFPGIPIQLVWPQVSVTLGESQNKKASFLREVIRALGLTTEVWGARVESMPTERVFDVVTMRAVDNPAAAMIMARLRRGEHGVIAQLTTEPESGGEVFRLPNSDRLVLRFSS